MSNLFLFFKGIINKIINAVKWYIHLGSNSILEIIIKIVIAIIGTIAFCILASKLWIIIWAAVSEILSWAAIILFILFLFFGDGISGYFSDNRIKQLQAQSNLDAEILEKMFKVASSASFASEFHCRTVSSPADLRPHVAGKRYSFFIPASRTAATDSLTKYEIYTVFQTELDSVYPYNGTVPVVDSINTGLVLGGFTVVILAVSPEEKNTIDKRWSKSIASDSSFNFLDFFDDDF